MPVDGDGASGGSKSIQTPMQWTMPGKSSSAFRLAIRRSKDRLSEPIAFQISQLLTARRPLLFCDDCITDQLRLSNRRQANRVTVVLGKRETFWRDVAQCSICLKHKQVVRHV
jgi:hypothetical protein